MHALYIYFKLIQILIVATAVKDAWSDRRWFTGGKISSLAWHSAGWVVRWGILIISGVGSVTVIWLLGAEPFTIVADVILGFLLASFHDLIYHESAAAGPRNVGGDELPEWYHRLKRLWDILPWVSRARKR